MDRHRFIDVAFFEGPSIHLNSMTLSQNPYTEMVLGT